MELTTGQKLTARESVAKDNRGFTAEMLLFHDARSRRSFACGNRVTRRLTEARAIELLHSISVMAHVMWVCVRVCVCGLWRLKTTIIDVLCADDESCSALRSEKLCHVTYLTKRKVLRRRYFDDIYSKKVK